MKLGLQGFLDGIQFGKCSKCGSEQSAHVHVTENLICTCGSEMEIIDLTREEKQAKMEAQCKAYECECGYIGLYEDEEPKNCRNCNSTVEKAPLLWKSTQYEAREERVKYWAKKISFGV